MAARGLLPLAVSLALVVGPAGRAYAQAPSNSSKVAAEALFEEGRKLVAEGKYAEACPKLADSQRLDASAATLLNLASCYEKLGHTATAWATYREAAGAANAIGRKDYVATAQRHADALAPKLARLTLTVAQPADGIQVKRDGVLVDRPEWGTAIPVDPGTHTLSASARGYKGWESTIQIVPDAPPTTVTVPPLEALPPDEAPQPLPAEGPKGAAPVVPVNSNTPAPLPVEPKRSDGTVQRVAGWVVTGLGVASAAVGGGLALAAHNKYKDALAKAPTQCEIDDPNTCSGEVVGERNDALSAGNQATWLLAAGAVAVVAGVVVVLTAPSAHHDNPAAPKSPAPNWVFAPTPGGALLRGQW